MFLQGAIVIFVLAFQIYISSKFGKCARIENGDRMGVFLEEAPGAVAYTFDASTPTALGHSLEDRNYPTPIDTVIPFDTLTFPYDFSVAAYIGTGKEAIIESTGGVQKKLPTCLQDF